MANYVKFKQGLKKDFNTTNQPLTNGMIYFVIDENNHGSIYYDTIVDGKKATKNGTVHRVKFSGLPIKITGSVIGTGVISQDGETIEINTSTNHSHGLAHQNFTVALSNDDINLKWTRLGNQNGGGFWLKSIRGQAKAPAWFLPDYSAGIAFGGEDTKGVISVRYSRPGVRFAGGNGDAPVWYFTITGSNDKTYDLNGIGGHSSDSAKLDHNVTFKIASTADATKGGNGTATNLSGSAVDLYLPTKISGFNLLQATRFQGNADTSTVAAKLGRGGNNSLPMTFYWNGQGGQPKWIWGGNDGTNMYVYNPSNFSVNYANSAATASRANVLNINNTKGLSNCLQYLQTSFPEGDIDSPGSSWYHVLKFNHGQGDTYYKRLMAFSFWGRNNIYTATAEGNGTTSAWSKFWLQGDSVTGAVWNDYAECRRADSQEPGYVMFEKGDDSLSKTVERLQHFAGVVSDTWGFSQGETDEAKTNIAVAGRVLVYPYRDRNEYKPGDCVCAAPDGKVDIMTREEVVQYPDRIVGTVSCVPDYEEWGGGELADRDPVKANGRIWIKVK